MKYLVKTKLSNITLLKDGTFEYTQDLVSMKWGTELDSQPDTLVSVVEEHLGDDLNPSDSTRQHEVTSDKPRDKESI